jgi:hypothetical protein
MANNNYSEKLWKKIDENLPMVRNMFEIATVNLKLTKFPNVRMHISFAYSTTSEPLIRCHIYKNEYDNIFIFYFNRDTKTMFIRNKLNHKGTLNVGSERIYIKSEEELQTFLNKLVLD